MNGRKNEKKEFFFSLSKWKELNEKIQKKGKEEGEKSNERDGKKKSEEKETTEYG